MNRNPEKACITWVLKATMQTHQTKRTDLSGQSRGGTNLTTNSTKLDCGPKIRRAGVSVEEGEENRETKKKKGGGERKGAIKIQEKESRKLTDGNLVGVELGRHDCKSLKRSGCLLLERSHRKGCTAETAGEDVFTQSNRTIEAKTPPPLSFFFFFLLFILFLFHASTIYQPHHHFINSPSRRKRNDTRAETYLDLIF